MSTKNQPNLTALFPDLNRPEYPPSPDALLSSLIYPHVAKTLSPFSADQQLDKWISYKWLTARNKDRVLQTRPSLDSEQEIDKFCKLIVDSGLSIESSEGHARAILDCIRGVTGKDAKSEITVALSPAIAALQDGRGIFAKNGPPNYDRIFHQLASLGKGEQINSGSLGKAALETLEGPGAGKITQLLDRVFKAQASGDGAPAECSSATHVPAWMNDLPTPFSWFSTSWDSLCSGNWIDRMPSRRWCDWASCVLRTATGMGFLWEAAFFERLGRSIINESSGSEEAEEFTRGAGTRLINWLPTNRRVTERSVNHGLISTIGKGLAVKKAICDGLFEDQDLTGSPEDWSGDPKALRKFIEVARAEVKKDRHRGEKIAIALTTSEVKGGANNTHETVRYSLIQRRQSGREADFYNLLKTVSRRYLVVDPGQEWLVVVASLAAKEAGGRVTLKDVTDELQKLGLAPGRKQLTAQLETCGLTRSFRDAEQAIEVAAAF